MNRCFALSLALTFYLSLTGSAFAQGEPLRLSWQFRKGDELRFELSSLIEKGIRKEAKLAGKIVITKIVSGEQVKGLVSFSKLYAIKELSGSGARAGKEKLAGHMVRCRLFKNGSLILNGKDLEKFEQRLEDVFEDLDLKSHFEGLLFELPKDPIKVGQSWTKFQDNCTYKFKLQNLESKAGSRIAHILGTPTNPNEGEEVQGSIKISFDVSKGVMLSLVERHTRIRSIGKVLKSENRTHIKRSLTIKRVESILDETRKPDLEPESKPAKATSKPTSKPSKGQGE